MSTKTITLGNMNKFNIAPFPTDLGGQFIGYKAGSVIDQIWVDSGNGRTVYGGNEGTETGSIQLPSNGIVHLREVYLGDHGGAISYLVFGIPDSKGGEEIINFGSSYALKYSHSVLTDADLWVKFYEICYGGYIAQLIFQIVD